MTTVPQLHTPPRPRPTFRATLSHTPVCAPAGIGLATLSVIVTLTFFSHSPDRWVYLALADAVLAGCLAMQIVICRLARSGSLAGPIGIRPMTVGRRDEHVCTPHDVATLIDQAVEAETVGLGRPDIHVLRDYTDVEDVCLDGPRVVTALRPLVRNAVEALQARDEGPQRVLLIRLTATPFVAGIRVRIELSDNGVGIAPRNLSRLFAAGFSTRPNHTGRGLHEAYTTVRQLQGTLSVASAGEGRGATFSVELPTHIAE